MKTMSFEQMESVNGADLHHAVCGGSLLAAMAAAPFIPALSLICIGVHYVSCTI